MGTRTWLTTPPGSVPTTDRPADGSEGYVPGPGLPREPAVPGRHQRRLVVGVIVLATLVAVLALVVLGERAQRQDPSIPDAPDAEPAGDGDGPPALPES